MNAHLEHVEHFEHFEQVERRVCKSAPNACGGPLPGDAWDRIPTRRARDFFERDLGTSLSSLVTIAKGEVAGLQLSSGGHGGF